MDSSVASQQPESYTDIAKFLHWFVAGLIVIQFVLADLANDAEAAESKFQELVFLANHKSVGITILALAIIRLIWRFYATAPSPAPMPNWQRLASEISHWSLYGLILLLPLTGWLMSSATSFSVSWFNLIQLPDLVGANEALAEVLEQVHETLAKVLFLLALIHIGAVLKHLLLDRHNILGRIASPLSLAMFFMVLVAGFVGLTGDGTREDVVMESELSDQSSFESDFPDQGLQGQDEQEEGIREQGLSDLEVRGQASLESVGTQPELSLPLWQIDYANSYIQFTAEQAGASFSGDWQEWRADIRFSASQLALSSAAVAIRVESVETLDKDRNETLLDSDWFDRDDFPEVYYQTSDFTVSADGSFISHGEMAVKGTGSPVKLMFIVTDDGSRHVLDGKVTLDRLALGVGIGEWLDTEWIGQMVDVVVHVEATVSELNDSEQALR